MRADSCWRAAQQLQCFLECRQTLSAYFLLSCPVCRRTPPWTLCPTCLRLEVTSLSSLKTAARIGLQVGQKPWPLCTPVGPMRELSKPCWMLSTRAECKMIIL